MRVCVFGSVNVRVRVICRVGCSRCCLIQDTKAYSTVRYSKPLSVSYRRAESELAERRRKSGMIDEDDGDEYSDDDKDAL